MNIHLQPRQETRLAEIADHRGMTKGELAREIICRYLDEHKASAEPDVDNRGGLGTEISALFSKHSLDVPIPELRGFTIQNPFKSPPKKAARLRPADSRGRRSPHKPSRKPRKKRT